MGKGDHRRPSAVSVGEYVERHEQIDWSQAETEPRNSHLVCQTCGTPRTENPYGAKWCTSCENFTYSERVYE